MDKKRFVFAWVVSFLFLAYLSQSLSNYFSRVSNVGVVRVIGVEIYRDEGLIEVLNEIDWGFIDPNDTKYCDAWIKNTGNDAQKLVMWTETWDPTNAPDFIALAWDYDETWIPVNASIPVSFILHVDPNIAGIIHFSFDIWIKGVH